MTSSDDPVDPTEPAGDAVVRAATISVGVMMAAVKVGQRSYLSSWMLRAAKRFTAQAQAIETEHPGDWTKGEQHVDLVMAAVLNAVAFIEAMINEVFTDAADDNGDLTPLNSANTRVMADWWREFDDGRVRTLTKYQQLLTFAGKPKLDTGAEPYQSAQALIDLRNAIVHYRPETIWSDEVHRLTRRLQGRFVSNALLHPSTDLRWPNGLLGAGCARWSHESAQRLTDRVLDTVGVTANYRALGV